MDRVVALGVQDATSHKRRQSTLQKRGYGTKVARTDSGSDGSTIMVDMSAQTSDSAQSSPKAAAVAHSGLSKHKAAANDCCPQSDAEQYISSEDCDCSGSEADGPIADRYIKGTRLIIGGWFQACRGCNEPTSRSAEISARDVPFCPRCQQKYMSMVSGEYPPNVGAVDTTIEPLSYWLPRMLGSMPRMEAQARREFCDKLVLRQDDAWLALIKSS